MSRVVLVTGPGTAVHSGWLKGLLQYWNLPLFNTEHSLVPIMGAGNCNGDSTCRDDFFSDPVAVGYYKDHVKTILNRVNTFNQRLYR